MIMQNVEKTLNQLSNEYNLSKYLRRHWNGFYEQLKPTKRLFPLPI